MFAKKIILLALFFTFAATSSSGAATITELSTAIDLNYEGGSPYGDTLTGNVTFYANPLYNPNVPIFSYNLPANAPYLATGTVTYSGVNMADSRSGTSITYTSNGNARIVEGAYTPYIDYVWPGIEGYYPISLNLASPYLNNFGIADFIGASGSVTILSETVSSVPLPASLPLFGCALLVLLSFAWIRSRQVARR